MTISRSAAALLLILGLSMPAGAGPALAADDWPVTTPADAGFAADLGDRLDTAFDRGDLKGLHGVVVIRGGKLVLERYYPGRDERWGRDLGRVDFGPDDLHDLRSVSKSVVGLLYGIALADGNAGGPDRPLVNQFPDLEDLAEDPARQRLTVADALTMRLGLEWNENLPYTDRRNSETAMEFADDRAQFVLSRPIVNEPGTRWQYSGGATALLAELIAQGSGQSLLDYARAKLFVPLGITEAEWVKGIQGKSEAAASGLRLRPRDLARIGQMVLNRGRWNGKQVVNASWLDRSFEQHVRFDRESGIVGYGYHWWLGRHRDSGKPWYSALGNGGQWLLIEPNLNIVLVVTAGNYNQPTARKVPADVQTIVLSALEIQ